MKSMYVYCRDIYRSMPPGVRNVIRGPAQRLAIGIWGLRQHPANDSTTSGSDLSWQQFKQNILAYAGQYKGVYIQNIMIEWDIELFQRPQQMSMALARRGYLVIYQATKWSSTNVGGFRQVFPNVWMTTYDVINEIPGAVVSTYSTDYLDATLLDHVDRTKCRVIYEYMDHIDPKISGSDEQVEILQSRKEKAFSGGADVIVASARALYEEAVAAVGADRVLLVPNGVDAAHFRKPHEGVSVPDDYLAFRKRFRHVVGFFGALAPWIWYDEVNRLIETRPDLGFIFIGPDYYGGSARLRMAPNVLCTGAIHHRVLPAYARHFDVCLIPFEPGEIARTTSPLKLFEYFALEKPVIATSGMAECVQFPEVLAGADAEELSRQIDRALLLKDDASFRARLARLADENDWDHRAGAYEQIFRGTKN